MVKQKLCTIVVAVTLCCTIGCSQETEKEVLEVAENVVQEVSEQAEDIENKEDENVLKIKNGHPEDYPDITYGEAFDNFFGSPMWEYLGGENKEDIVEFTGYYTYQNTEVKVRVQFILNEDGTFTSGALSFNDVLQSQLITKSTLEKAFEQYRQKNVSNGINENKVATVMELTDYLGDTSADFYRQSGLELEVYGAEGWAFSGYEDGLDVSEVRDASGYYITLSKRQLEDTPVSLMGIMVGDSYDDIKSLIEGTITYTSDTVEEYQFENGDVAYITFDAVSRVITKIVFGHFPQVETEPVTVVSPYDSSGKYVAGTQIMSITVPTEGGDDPIVGMMEWSDSATGETEKAEIYEYSEFTAVFNLKGVDYKIVFFTNGATWYDANNSIIMNFEKTESYRS